MSNKFHIDTFIENKMAIRREVTYICPECHRIAKFSVNNFHGLQVCGDDINIEITDCSLKLNVECIDCESFMFECDKDLANIIADLNHVGIKTTHCCQGHVYPRYRPFDKYASTEIFPFYVSWPYVNISVDGDSALRDKIINIVHKYRDRHAFYYLYQDEQIINIGVDKHIVAYETVSDVTALKKTIDDLPQIKLGQQRFKFSIQAILSLMPIIIVLIALNFAKNDYLIAINVIKWCSVSFGGAILIDGLFLKYINAEIKLRAKALELVEVDKRRKLV
jgi:hypothetical protein